MKKNEQREVAEGATIQLPFIVVNTDRNTIVECQMTEDKYVCYNYNNNDNVLLIDGEPLYYAWLNVCKN